MKRGFRLLTIIFLLTAGKLFAQDALALAFPGDTKKAASTTSSLPVFEFRASSNEYDLSSISKDMIGDHILGDQVAQKLYLLESKYTYEVPIVPGNPQTRTMIRKPIIYEAVIKIERYLKKSVKKGGISTEAASAELNKVLDVAFNVLTADTESFETIISKTDDTATLTNLFTNQVKLLF
jgi:hypothetical protein